MTQRNFFKDGFTASDFDEVMRRMLHEPLTYRKDELSALADTVNAILFAERNRLKKVYGKNKLPKGFWSEEAFDECHGSECNDTHYALLIGPFELEKE